VAVLESCTKLPGDGRGARIQGCRSTNGGPSLAANDLLAVSSFYPGLELATTGVHWLTGLPLVGAQILVVLLARSSSDKTRLIPPT
jgi:hypothetical protein